jgi:hypothetical protein
MAPGALPHAFTILAFILHVGGGMVGLVAGWIALFAAKGSRLHRASGNVFFIAMIVMAVFADYLALVMPGQLVNFFIGTFAFYLIATAWLTVQRPEGVIGLPEKIAFVVILTLCVPFSILSFQLLTGMPPMLPGPVPYEGPVLIALYGFTAVILIATISDARVLIGGGISGAPRIARHLWRMCVGLTLATGSAFTNGFSRFLPGPHHVPRAFFLPQLVPLALLVFWIVRVRFTRWSEKRAAAAAA